MNDLTKLTDKLQELVTQYDLDEEAHQNLKELFINDDGMGNNTFIFTAVSLGDFKKWARVNDEDLNDFVYIRRWELVLCNVSAIRSHSFYLSCLNGLLHLIDTNQLDSLHASHSIATASGKDFLRNHHGFFMSSVSTRNSIEIDDDMRMTAQERTAFQDYSRVADYRY